MDMQNKQCLQPQRRPQCTNHYTIVTINAASTLLVICRFVSVTYDELVARKLHVNRCDVDLPVQQMDRLTVHLLKVCRAP